MPDPSNKKSPEEMHTFAISPASIVFQALLILASCYYAMLMTNWGDPTMYGETEEFFTNAASSYWIKFSALWAS